MLDGKHYTKQQAAAGTGLSVATCNTLLNDLQMHKIVSGEKRQLGEVGRSSVLYRNMKATLQFISGSNMETEGLSVLYFQR